MISHMVAEELVHDVPFPLFARGMIGAMGVLALVLPGWELWRGVWPLNVTTPFFAFIILGSGGLGLAAVNAALRGASGTLVFRPGELEVRQDYLRSRRVRVFPLAEIATIATRVNRDSDGPDSWTVQIKLASGEEFSSRSFDTEVTARKWEAEFRRVLGL